MLQRLIDVDNLCDTSVGIFHRKMDLAPDVGGTEVPATMAGKVRNVGPSSQISYMVAQAMVFPWKTRAYGSM